jgi:hypothetical protein
MNVLNLKHAGSQQPIFKLRRTLRAAWKRTPESDSESPLRVHSGGGFKLYSGLGPG